MYNLVKIQFNRGTYIETYIYNYKKQFQKLHFLCGFHMLKSSSIKFVSFIYESTNYN